MPWGNEWVPALWEQRGQEDFRILLRVFSPLSDAEIEALVPFWKECLPIDEEAEE